MGINCSGTIPSLCEFKLKVPFLRVGDSMRLDDLQYLEGINFDGVP